MAASNPGPATDAAGQPVVDPTKNVLSLVEAAIKRQDDLRAMEIGALRREMEIRADYERQLSRKETERLDAIRTVDINAVQRAAEVAEVRAGTLQAQVAAAADAMRTQVASATQTAQEALIATVKPIADALAVVQQAQYLQAGQQAQRVETRDVRADRGMSTNIAIAIAGFLLALLVAYLATKK